MNDDTPIPPQSAAESADALRAQRAEQQRQQRILQLEEQLADAKLREEQAQTRLATATQRRDAIEAELDELQTPEDGAP
jgi:chromosome segregation ATPase